MKPTWESDCGTVKLWLGDCLDVMQSWPDGAVDAVVTDPPYGIGEAAGKNKSRSELATSRNYGNKPWDNATQPERVLFAIDHTREAVVFGGNYYPFHPTSCWLIWDKMNGANDFADCELAWTNLSGAVRQKRFRWHGMLREGNDGQRVHPTQKPVEVLAWCIGFTTGEIVTDPFMGSGTTGVAAVRLGRQFWGVEIDPQYFEIAKRRIQDELRKFEFLEPERVQQGELFE